MYFKSLATKSKINTFVKLVNLDKIIIKVLLAINTAI